jgi:hypothetical protein
MIGHLFSRGEGSRFGYWLSPRVKRVQSDCNPIRIIHGDSLTGAQLQSFYMKTSGEQSTLPLKLITSGILLKITPCK